MVERTYNLLEKAYRQTHHLSDPPSSDQAQLIWDSISLYCVPFGMPFRQGVQTKLTRLEQESFPPKDLKEPEFATTDVKVQEEQEHLENTFANILGLAKEEPEVDTYISVLSAFSSAMSKEYSCLVSVKYDKGRGAELSLILTAPDGEEHTFCTVDVVGKEAHFHGYWVQNKCNKIVTSKEDLRDALISWSKDPRFYRELMLYLSPLEDEELPSKPRKVFHKWNLESEAKEIALRTGTKRIRQAIMGPLTSFWARKSCPRLAGESDHEYESRFQATKNSTAKFLESEAGQGFLSLVLGSSWALLEGDYVEPGSVMDYGSLFARECRIQGGTDILNSFITEALAPVFRDIKNVVSPPSVLGIRIDTDPESVMEPVEEVMTSEARRMQT